MIQSRRKWTLKTTPTWIMSLLLLWSSLSINIMWMNHHRPSILVMVVSMSASPIPYDVQLPDGSTITLVLDGDEFEHYERDLNGYTTLRDHLGYCYYALPLEDGSLMTSTFRVGSVDPTTLGIAKYLRDTSPKDCHARFCRIHDGDADEEEEEGRFSTTPVEDLFVHRRQRRATRLRLGQGESSNHTSTATPETTVLITSTSSGPKEHLPQQQPPPRQRRVAAQTKGVLRNLVVPIRFKDHDNRNLPSVRELDILFNNVGPHPTLCPTGSIRDVFTENSYGTLDLVSTVLDWVTVPYTEAEMAAGQSGFTTKTWIVLRTALNMVNKYVDFRDFDMDNDGVIDAIAFIHSGYAAEWGGLDVFGTDMKDRIWSHKAEKLQWRSQERILVDIYHISPGLYGTRGNSIGRIGVIAHETGHFLGLVDLYDLDSSQTGELGSGIGSWGLMSNSWGFNGDQRYPPHFCAWNKIRLGWITPQTVQYGLNYVSATEPVKANYPRVVKIGDGQHGFPPGEYLLIENRQPIGFDRAIPQGGLVIFHIDETLDRNYNTQGYPGQDGWPGNGKHYPVAVLQADGQYDLEKDQNRGDAGDVYHALGIDYLGPSAGDNINNGPFPNTDAYRGGNVYKTTNEIFAISLSGVDMSFQFTNKDVPRPTSTPSTSLQPTFTASVQPSGAPAFPSMVPTNYPSLTPVIATTGSPIAADMTSHPSLALSPSPSSTPSYLPTGLSSTPSANPSHQPSEATDLPSAVPSCSPLRMPTGDPTASPSHPPSSMQPSGSPLSSPTVEPITLAPSSPPSWSPSPAALPSLSPSQEGSLSLTRSSFPTSQPSGIPRPTLTQRPTGPSTIPSSGPSQRPIEIPDTALSTAGPTLSSPTGSLVPIGIPNGSPSSANPTFEQPSPSSLPSVAPSSILTIPNGSQEPTERPSCSPSLGPSAGPATLEPNSSPTLIVTSLPSLGTSRTPSVPSEPNPNPTSEQPSFTPSTKPSWPPSSFLSLAPSTSEPSSSPSVGPTPTGSQGPSQIPSCVPSSEPSWLPSLLPNIAPSPGGRSSSPSVGPTPTDSQKPTHMPSRLPSLRPSANPSTLEPSSSPTQIFASTPSLGPSSVPSIWTPSFSASPESAQPSLASSILTTSTLSPGSPSLSPNSGPMPTELPLALMAPSDVSSQQPCGESKEPTLKSDLPSSNPSESPSSNPTEPPSTAMPTTTEPSLEPSHDPTRSGAPSLNPSAKPSETSESPTLSPSQPKSPRDDNIFDQKTNAPSLSIFVSDKPSVRPSMAATTFAPSLSKVPSHVPSSKPSVLPSSEPTLPTQAPTEIDNSIFVQLTSAPSILSKQATTSPSQAPDASVNGETGIMLQEEPFLQDETYPSVSPVTQLEDELFLEDEPSRSTTTTGPSDFPSNFPSDLPIDHPSISPTSNPTDSGGTSSFFSAHMLLALVAAFLIYGQLA